MSTSYEEFKDADKWEWFDDLDLSILVERLNEKGYEVIKRKHFDRLEKVTEMINELYDDMGDMISYPMKKM